MNEEKIAAALYGNPGGSPADPGALNTALGAALDAIEHGARDEGDHEYAVTVAAARKDLVSGLEGLGVGPGVAKELAEMIQEYHGKPRDEATMARNLDEALGVLAEEWGPDFGTTFAGAKKIIAKLIGNNTANLEFFHGTGLSRDVRFLRMAGALAQAKMKAQTRRPSGRKFAENTSISDRLYDGGC